ncbi:unnamed protein product [Ambrosiozyma monospora]|uniref:Unnamed protein product n=1 Tax=Ambrosiozyma monospora TaxID=43982 RepID=A0A9W6Z1J4_AMBMO|nr:unnamed protein product [Ambrosiozyma monospora]
MALEATGDHAIKFINRAWETGRRGRYKEGNNRSLNHAGQTPQLITIHLHHQSGNLNKMFLLYLVLATLLAQTHAAQDFGPEDAVSYFMDVVFADFAYWEATADPSDVAIYSSFTKKWGSSVEPLASSFIEDYDGEQDTAAIQNLYLDAITVFDTPEFTSDYIDMLSDIDVTQDNYYFYDTNTGANTYYSNDFSDFADIATETGNARSTIAAYSSGSDDSDPDSDYPSTSRGDTTNRVTSPYGSDDDTDETFSRNNDNPTLVRMIQTAKKLLNLMRLQPLEKGVDQEKHILFVALQTLFSQLSSVVLPWLALSCPCGFNF